MKHFIALLVLLPFFGSSQNTGVKGPAGTVTDMEGNVYPTTVIGQQEWMAENLRVTSYRDGAAIPLVGAGTQSRDDTEGSYAIFPPLEVEGVDFVEDIMNAYGLLYNWYAVNDPRGICPPGWHVPTDEEWTRLSDYLTGSDEKITMADLGNKLKSCRKLGSPFSGGCDTSEHPRWNANIFGDEASYGSDDFGFSALPGGVRLMDASFFGLGFLGFWWSATEFSPEYAWHRSLISGNGYLDRSYTMKELGFSVRCVRRVLGRD